jgi:hypothetical protein
MDAIFFDKKIIRDYRSGDKMPGRAARRPPSNWTNKPNWTN